MDIEYSVTCDMNYYGDCSNYCKPNLHHYCDSVQGRKICYQGNYYLFVYLPFRSTRLHSPGGSSPVKLSVSKYLLCFTFTHTNTDVNQCKYVAIIRNWLILINFLTSVVYLRKTMKNHTSILIKSSRIKIICNSI